MFSFNRLVSLYKISPVFLFSSFSVISNISENKSSRKVEVNVGEPRESKLSKTLIIESSIGFGLKLYSISKHDISQHKLQNLTGLSSFDTASFTELRLNPL